MSGFEVRQQYWLDLFVNLSDIIFTLFSQKQRTNGPDMSRPAHRAARYWAVSWNNHASSKRLNFLSSRPPRGPQNSPPRRATMINFVNALADLTAIRDREELEFVMAQLAADLLGAVGVKLWRVLGHPPWLHVHERLAIVDGVATLFDPPSDIGVLPLLNSKPELDDCYHGKIPRSAAPGADGINRRLFPVLGARGIVGLLDVHVAAPLRDDQLRLASGLLRIYQNHLKILDYSEKDELTGLLNRKTLDDAFRRLTRIEASGQVGATQFQRVDRRRPVDPVQPRWLAVMDIDFFKRVNDRFGHSRGDEVLASVAQLMRNSFRESDQLFRCGGEEFVVMLQPTDPQFVRGILERFRVLIETHEFPGVGAVTLSTGYTRVAADDDGALAFRRADAALYAAKRRGRNRVVFDEELSEEAGVPEPVSELDALTV
jgi:diguanylate cyclase (GGDEF)-like protein